MCADCLFVFVVGNLIRKMGDDVTLMYVLRNRVWERQGIKGTEQWSWARKWKERVNCERKRTRRGNGTTGQSLGILAKNRSLK
jgi:hypothetical protein